MIASPKKRNHLHYILSTSSSRNLKLCVSSCRWHGCRASQALHQARDGTLQEQPARLLWGVWGNFSPILLTKASRKNPKKAWADAWAEWRSCVVLFFLLLLEQNMDQWLKYQWQVLESCTFIQYYHSHCGLLPELVSRDFLSTICMKMTD